MAIAKNGPNGDHIGRIGNMVYYMLDGKNVARQIGRTTKPATAPQLKSRLITKISSQFLSKFKDFLTVGFSMEALKTKRNAFNEAVKYNRNEITQGIYPDLEIAYNKVTISKGALKQPENLKTTQSPDGLLFSWDTNPKMDWLESTDQAMMLAYFPEQDKTIYTLFGNSRLSGIAELEIPPSLREKYMETYFSFIAIDRKQIADSVYTGKFNKEELPENLILNP